MPAMTTDYCGRCLRQAPAFVASYVGLRYEREIIALMYRFKFRGEVRAGVLLASLMLETLVQMAANERPQTLVALPRHPQRAKEFGFDQADWLAGYLSRRLGIPVATARRTRHTPTQRGLDREARRKNLQNVFQMTEPLRGRVAVVDDILTTGASMDALAHACQVAGAEEVMAWAIARTPRERQSSGE